MTRPVRRWIGMGLMGLGAFALHTQSAQGHVVTGAQNPTSCSPHNQSASNGGSTFSSCAYSIKLLFGYNYFWWQRNFACAAGTGCSKALCSGKAVSGASKHFWPTYQGGGTHGAKGGHSPNIQTYNCL